MSNTKAWRAKDRTSKPNSRQKRNGLFLDERPICQACNRRRSEHAHHHLPKGHPDRYSHRYMRALCEPCHVKVHRPRCAGRVFMMPVGR
ncbi:MAG TPA: hypothetical protein VF463_19120 [Sphingobium sp.]